MPGEKRTERELLRRRSVAPPPKERFEVLVEELRSEFKAVAEGQTVLARRMDEHERRHEERFIDLKNVIMAIRQGLNAKN